MLLGSAADLHTLGIYWFDKNTKLQVAILANKL